jgi:hypothetical protein
VFATDHLHLFLSPRCSLEDELHQGWVGGGASTRHLLNVNELLGARPCHRSAACMSAMHHSAACVNICKHHMYLGKLSVPIWMVENKTVV